MRRTSIVVGMGLLCSFFILGCSTKAPEKEMVRPVRAVKVGDMSGLTERSFPGQAKATQEVDLSFRVSGPLISRPIDVGDVVKEGQVVARIDPRDFEVNLRNTEAQLAQAKASLRAMRKARPEDIRRLTANVNKAEAAYKRATADYDRLMRIKTKDPGAVSQGAIDRETENKDRTEAQLRKAGEELQIGKVGARKEDIQAKEAEIRSLQASVDSAKDQLGYTYLKAPFTGKVVNTYVENYEYVQAKQPIVRILDASKIEIVIAIPENLISYASYVTDIFAEFDAFPGRKIPARIKEIGTEASQTTRTYPVTMIMDQPEGIEILPGMAGKMTGKGKLPANVAQKGIQVPVSAVFAPDTSGKSYVWVIDDDTKTVSKREVKSGGLTDFGVSILDGLKPGEWIAVAGVHYLKEGQKVRILSEETDDSDKPSGGVSS